MSDNTTQIKGLNKEQVTKYFFTLSAYFFNSKLLIVTEQSNEQISE